MHFLKKNTYENLIKDQSIFFPFADIALVLSSFSLKDVLILFEENRCWSFLGLKACLHEGGGPQVGEVACYRWGYPPVHKIPHFNLITFT